MGKISDFTLLIYRIIGLLIAISVHEMTHAWTANYLGDQTAKRAGRITLNPLAHLDPIGTIMLFLVGFGWGKPVPINPNNFGNPRLGSALTAISGPISNLVIAIAFTFAYKSPIVSDSQIAPLFLTIIIINIVLMAFNLFPIPPLDGSKFFALFIPKLDDPKFEVYGPVVLIIFLFFGGRYLLLPVVNFFLNILNVQFSLM